MNIRRVQGWALVISALVNILLQIFNITGLTNRIQYSFEILMLISGLFFIFGLFGIQTTQPTTKYWGQIGLALMLIPALDKITFSLMQLFENQSLEFNSFVSSIWIKLASLGILYVGYILVGWLTIRARIFPTPIGWLLLIVGVINNAIWLFVLNANLDDAAFSAISTLLIFIGWLEIATIAGYGWSIIRYKTFLDSDEIKTMKDKGDVESLIKILQKEKLADWMYRLDAAEALAQIGVQQGMDYLTSRLQESDIDEKNEIKEILEKLSIKQI